jgi:hypothetical protein
MSEDNQRLIDMQAYAEASKKRFLELLAQEMNNCPELFNIDSRELGEQHIDDLVSDLYHGCLSTAADGEYYNEDWNREGFEPVKSFTMEERNA